MSSSSIANTLALMVVMALLSPSTSKAAEHRIECPAKLEPGSLKISSPAGWSSFVPVGVWLHSAGPMDGPPSVMAILKEDHYSEHGNKIVTKWVWGSKGDSYPEGKWMACNYGAANEVILSKRIDDNVSECTVTYTRNKPRRDDIDIRCKW
jgi:hypothetical protein